MKGFKHLTQEQIVAIVAEYAAGASSHDLGEKYSKSSHAILHAIRRAGGKTRTRNEAMAADRRADWKSNNVLSPEQVEAMSADYAAGMTSTECAVKYGIGVGTAFRYLDMRGEMRSQAVACSVYTHDPAAFDSLTNDSLYWMGFLAADGCVNMRESHRGNPILSLKLNAVDRGHLEKYRAFLKATNPINVELRPPNPLHTANYVAIPSLRLCNALIGYGITPRKTHTIKVDDRLSIAARFWCGVLDGDGDFAVAKNRTETPRLNLVSASVPFLNQYCDFIEREIGLRPLVRLKEGNTFSVSVGGAMAIALLRKLYVPGEVALDRKAVRAAGLIARFDAGDWLAMSRQRLERRIKNARANNCERATV